MNPNHKEMSKKRKTPSPPTPLTSTKPVTVKRLLGLLLGFLHVSINVFF